MSTVWVAYGRMNPPTVGHGKMLDQLKKLAGNDDYQVWPTWTQGKVKDPLDHPNKVKWLKKMHPNHAPHVMSDRNLRTLPKILEHLMMQGYTDVVIVCGSDRTVAFENFVNYNRKETGKGQAYYAFNSMRIDSTGLKRDPDSDGAEGMSATKMRNAAKNVDSSDFVKGLDGLLNTSDALSLMADVRKGMGL